MSSEDIKTLDELIEYLDNRGQFPLLSQELFMINITWNKRLEKLEAENKRLRQALEVYADRGNWFVSDMDEFEFAFGYAIAQEALKW